MSDDLLHKLIHLSAENGAKLDALHQRFNDHIQYEEKAIESIVGTLNGHGQKLEAHSAVINQAKGAKMTILAFAGLIAALVSTALDKLTKG